MIAHYYDEPYRIVLTKIREGIEKNVLYIHFDIWQNDEIKYNNSIVRVDVDIDYQTLRVTETDDGCSLPFIVRKIFNIVIERILRHSNEEHDYYRYKDNEPFALHERKVPTAIHKMQASVEISNELDEQLAHYFYVFHLLRMNEELAHHQHCWFDWNRITNAYRTGSVAYYWSVCRDITESQMEPLGLQRVPNAQSKQVETNTTPSTTWEDELNALLERYQHATPDDKKRIEHALNELQARYARIQKPFG